MTMKWKERLAAVACFALFCFAFIKSREFPDIPQIIPTGVTLLGMLLCLALCAKTFMAKYPDGDQVFVPEKKEGMVKTLLAVLLLAAYVLLVRVVGFYTVSFVFMIVFSYVIDSQKHKLWIYPLVAVGLLSVVYAIFTMFLSVPLPKGIFL